MINEEVVDLIMENSDEAREILFKNYEYIIFFYLKKYKNTFYKISIEYQDAHAECLYAFYDAINNYDPNKDSTFSTFLSLCVQRRLVKVIRSASTLKNKFNLNTYSLDYVYEDFGMALLDIVVDENNEDPMKILESKETDTLLNSKILEVLSSFEIEVYKYMLDNINYTEIADKLEKDPKQIDNAIQRIKLKIKNILNTDIFKE
ncbi:MAG: hypothetical protein R3Y13_02745 [bacterium]